MCCGGRLHAHLRPVVDQVLQRVATGEHVHHLLAVGHGSYDGVLGVDLARDVDELEAGEVREHPGPGLLRHLVGGGEGEGEFLSFLCL